MFKVVIFRNEDQLTHSPLVAKTVTEAYSKIMKFWGKTNNESPKNIEKWFELGLDQVLVTPFNDEEMFAVIVKA